MVERLHGMQEVVGSIPIASTREGRGQAGFLGTGLTCLKTHAAGVDTEPRASLVL